jgi:cytochrome c oxidase subunit IV
VILARRGGKQVRITFFCVCARERLLLLLPLLLPPLLLVVVVVTPCLFV